MPTWQELLATGAPPPKGATTKVEPFVHPTPKVEPFVQITNSLDGVGTQTPTFRAFYRRNPRFAPGLGPEHARLQVVIKSDSYQHQRYGKVLVWSDNSMAWHEVATLATHEVPDTSYQHPSSPSDYGTAELYLLFRAAFVLGMVETCL
jgi:hypothetical protein